MLWSGYTHDSVLRSHMYMSMLRGPFGARDWTKVGYVQEKHLNPPHINSLVLDLKGISGA